MKTIIAGSRDFFDKAFVYSIIEEFHSQHTITQVICGCAKGVDTIGNIWAIENKIPIRYFKPDWNTFGDAAGPIRNEKMAKSCRRSDMYSFSLL